ncbi:hypothetical protein ACFV27_37095 [Streptomyces antimycoticus]|uniref:hypothetical protein n=1 Tax=Streptomyces antimycoticus TaxID=68175 RepID=UPI00367595C7
MTGIQTPNQNGQQLGPVVWILSKGERHEGGDILGVFADKDLGRGQFVLAAQDIHRSFGIDDIREDEHGAVHLEGGCDWLSLEPYTVTTTAQINA